MTSALISVIVPHLDDLERLKLCVAALEAQSLPRHLFEIIVADNGSRCGIAAVKAAVPTAKVVRISQRGAGPARNGGIAQATGAVLAFTDSDCVPDRNWLAAGVIALDTHGLAGGQVRIGVADAAHPTPAEAFELAFAFDNRRYVEERGFSVTANLFARREVADDVGGFATGVPEDLDWCRRALATGATIGYAADAIVEHPARDSYPALARKWRRLTDEAWRDWRAAKRSPFAWAARAAAVLASPVAHSVRVLTSPQLADLPSKRDALAVLFKIRAQRAAWMLAQAAEEIRTPSDAKQASASA